MSFTQNLKRIKKAENLLVTPKIIAFLEKHPDGVVWDEAGYELWRELTHRASGNEDRSGRFGASSRGTCPRAQIFSFLGMPATRTIGVDQQNLFNDGKWRHLRWQMMAMQAGALTHAEWPVNLPKYRVKASIDGLNTNEKFGFELKGDRRWARVLDGVPEAHILQVHTYLLAMGWDTFVYMVENKETQEFREVIVHRDEAVIREVRQELQELNEYVEYNRLPPILPACAAKEGPYRSCPYAQQCIKQHESRGNAYPQAGRWDS